MDIDDILPGVLPKHLPPAPQRRPHPPATIIASRRKTCTECSDHYGTGCWKDADYGCTITRNAAFSDAVHFGACPIARWADAHSFRPRGIITLAGGVVYTLNAYILCRLLRNYGCTLPIEWFYLGSEMRPEWEEFILAHVPDLEMINLGGNGSKDKWRGGWQAKTKAILDTSFQEVLFLDADSHPLRDPTYLFDDPLFRDNGAVLWPDCWGPNNAETLEKWTAHFGVCPHQQTESGQLLFDKSRCRTGLEQAHKLNTTRGTYNVIYGDKDTFAIGFMQTKTPFVWNPHSNPAFGGMMHPRDFQGRKLLAHLVRGKWLPSMMPRVTIRNYPMLRQAQEFGREIAGLLDPNFTPAALAHSDRVQRQMTALRRRGLLV